MGEGRLGKAGVCIWGAGGKGAASEERPRQQLGHAGGPPIVGGRGRGRAGPPPMHARARHVAAACCVPSPPRACATSASVLGGGQLRWGAGGVCAGSRRTWGLPECAVQTRGPLANSPSCKWPFLAPLCPRGSSMRPDHAAGCRSRRGEARGGGGQRGSRGEDVCVGGVAGALHTGLRCVQDTTHGARTDTRSHIHARACARTHHPCSTHHLPTHST